MGLRVFFELLGRAINAEYDRRVKDASNVIEYGAGHGHGHGHDHGQSAVAGAAAHPSAAESATGHSPATRHAEH